jgi:predicted dehydrogenase
MTRVGLAGYGLAGAQFHAPLLAAAGADIVAVATANPDRVARARAEQPRAQVVADLTALLRIPDLDLVVLATPSGQHLAHAHQVIAAGRPLVVDKPLAVDARAAFELLAHAAADGIPLTVFQNRRYDPDFATVRALTAAGTLGEVRRTECRWERWRPTPKDQWRERLPAEQGGGLLLDLHSHLVDQAVLLHGPVATVYAELSAWTTEAEDDAFLSLRHTGGAQTHLLASSVSAAPGPRWRVTGSTGTYLYGGLPGEPSAFPDADGPSGSVGWVVRGEQREAVEPVPTDPADFYRAVLAALDAPDPRAAMPVDPRDAVHVLAVLDAARASDRTRRATDVGTPGEGPT